MRAKRLASDYFKSGSAIIHDALVAIENSPKGKIEKSIELYSEGYLALRTLIRDRTDLRDQNQLLAAAFAVYGWMPTILKRIGNVSQLSRLALELEGLPFSEARPIVWRATTFDSGSPFLCLNNSVVGTSKLLHFLLPNLFPIWDSRISRLFGFKNQAHNSPAAYFSYFDLLHSWLNSGNALSPALSQKMQIGAPSNDPVSELRLVEYILFLASISKFGDDTTDRL